MSGVSKLIDRRAFLAGGLTMAAGSSLVARGLENDAAPVYSTKNRRWQQAYDKALAILAGNVQVMPRVDKPVLIEGSNYAGIWQECGPHEALVYRHVRPDVARNSHETFFLLQRPDGQLPANNKRTEAGFGQIQMVVPIAATAWDVASTTLDEELMHLAYDACSRWDAWLGRFRNTRETGLVEGFCTYDTGHDHSPRWDGIPPQCPDKDAKRFPPIATLPRLCPDLSATVFGGRVALAKMAKALGKPTEADRWTESAEHIRHLILSKLYVPEDAAFYDLDAEGNFVKVRSDILSRICGEHVVDQKLFDELWTRQIHNPKAFWPAYPLPSIAMDDPTFVRPIPANSWGGASQALTALRALRWFDHYERGAELSVLMDRWCEAIQRDMSFRQQIDPLNGEFTQGDLPGYSPTSLMMMEFTWQLAGVRQAGDELHWNVRPGHAASDAAHFQMRTDAGRRVEMQYGSGGVDLRIDGRLFATVASGTARLITDQAGKCEALLGTSIQTQKVMLRIDGQPSRTLTVAPNQKVTL
jgi:hypothetical protein